MRGLVTLLIAFLNVYVAQSQRGAGDCAHICNDMRHDILTLDMCREARKTLPKPKVGDFCSIAMEQGFSDVCIPLCLGDEPVNRIVQSCRHAAMEQPRPTVRRWCEHGYNVAYQKTSVDLQNHFSFTETKSEPEPEPEPEPVAVETKAEVPEAKAAEVVDHKVEEVVAKAEHTPEQPDHEHDHHNLRVASEGPAIIASIPITLDEDEVILNVHDGESAEDAVVAFCREHVADEVAACIRQLLPTVLERMDEINTAAAAAASGH